MIRLTYWDSIKGLAIIAVIIIHASTLSLKFPIDSLNFLFGISLRQIVNFAVPIFFAIAGLFSVQKIEQSSSSFIKKRILVLLPTYIIWTLIYIIIFKHEHFFSLKDIFLDFFLGKGVGIGYFVIVLIQFILITPLIWKLKTMKSHILIMISMFIIGMIYRYNLSIYYPDSILAHFPYNGILFIVWYPFYHFGIFISIFKKEVKNIIKKYLWIIFLMFVVSLMLSFIEGYIFASYGLSNFGASQVKISSLFTSFLFFNLLLYLYFEKKAKYLDNKYLAWLGINSYIIYLSHLAILDVLVHIMKKNNYLYNFQPLFIVLLSFCTFLIIILMIIVMKKILSPQINKYLGIR